MLFKVPALAQAEVIKLRLLCVAGQFNSENAVTPSTLDEAFSLAYELVLVPELRDLIKFGLECFQLCNLVLARSEGEVLRRRCVNVAKEVGLRRDLLRNPLNIVALLLKNGTLSDLL